MNEVWATLLKIIIEVILREAFPRVVKYIHFSYLIYQEKYRQYRIEKKKYDFTNAVLMSVQGWPIFGTSYPWPQWRARQWNAVILEIYNAGAAGIPINYWGVSIMLTCDRQDSIYHSTVPHIVPHLSLRKQGTELLASWQPVEDRRSMQALAAAFAERSAGRAAG